MKNNHLSRCGWVPAGDELYEKYHDQEWGVPVFDDRVLFEFLVLESAQAGLSWITVLRKRENYRALFAEFDPEKVARFNARKIQSLLKNPGIIRNELKIKAAISNAQEFLKVQKEFGSFARYIWDFVGGKPIINQRKSMKGVPATTAESDALSLDLKKRGFKFVGSTIMYAHMQACGMVNDHTTNCFRYPQLSPRIRR